MAKALKLSAISLSTSNQKPTFKSQPKFPQNSTIKNQMELQFG